MDVTDDCKKSSKPTLTLSNQCISHCPTDHAIPQMVITSADDTSEDQCNVTECRLVLISPVDVSSLSSTGQESVPAQVSDDKHEVDFEDISIVVRDVVSKCTDTVSHSVRQRPLIMEVDKCVQQDEGVVRCPTPPSPPPPIITSPAIAHQPILTSPTTMQRPLRFEGVAKTETSAVLDSGKDLAVNKHIEIQGKLNSDAAINEVHSIPQTTESTKSPADSSCSSPTTKEGSHGVKKFFDSLWHSETQASVSDSTEPMIQTPTQEPTQIPKSEKKSSIKIFFCSPKSETPKDKSEIFQPESPETPIENKEVGFFTKDAKQSIKSFFDTFKHEPHDSMDKNSTQVKSKDVHPAICLDATVVSSLSPEPSKDGKDSKHPIKSFFGTFKHESSDSKITSPKKSASHPDFSKESQDLNIHSPETHDKELSKEAKESSNFSKDTKQNIKAFFDTFKYEPSDQKHKVSAFRKSTSQPDFAKESNGLSKSLQESSEIPKVKDHTSFTKETKQNLKSFFDTFKHEPSALKHKDVQKKLSDAQLSPVQESVKKLDNGGKESKPDTELKTSTSFAKDTKQNIKAFFDTFKHESGEQKQKEIELKKSTLSELDLQREFDHESKEIKTAAEVKSSASFVKDTKQNIKAFFKHDSGEQKHKEVLPQTPVLTELDLHKNFDPDGKEIRPDVEVKPSTSFAKDTKQNIKAFFKHDSEQKRKEFVLKKPTFSETDLPKEFDQEGKEMKPDAEVKAATSFGKDTKQNIKAFFDTFKHDSGEQKYKEVISKKSTLSEPNLHKESADASITQSKDSKHPLKKLFSFKHSEDGSEMSSAQLSGSFEGPSEKELKKQKPVKVGKSVKLDLVPTYSWNGAENIEKTPHSFGLVNGHDNEPINGTKVRAQSVPSYASRSDKHFEILPESTPSAILSPTEKSSEQQKETLHGFKKFFDSFKHEKSDIEKSASCSGDFKHEKKQILTDSGHEMNEVKTHDKSTKNKKSKVIKRSLSDKVSREEVVQNFKGFFDSIGNKSPSKKSVKEAEHIYDTVEVKTEVDSPLPVIQVSFEVTESSVKSPSSKNEGQGVKKFFSSFHSKDSSKPISDKTSTNHRFGEKDSSKVDESIRKDILHESRKSTKLVTDLSQFSSSQVNVSPQNEKDADLNSSSTKVSEPVSSKPDKVSVFNSIGENILALKEKMMHGKEKRKSDIFDDLTESVQIEPASSSQKAVADPSLKEELIKNVNKIKPVPPEKPAKNKALTKVQTSPNKAEALKEEPSTSPGSPNSLYDTCCMKIAVLLRDKALDIVSEHTKSPPPKPPKPSAETIARARAAAVSRRLEAQRRGQSISDNFNVGCDGIRFADDETESSCDYKDVENFDYIMDYELINRYKIENKFDTFSVPSTCSGLTSYYTADTITLRSDIYSDAVLETVSLNSDTSYNLKQISSSSKSEPRISARYKEPKTLPDTKQLKVKKVPPPIPPKPMILQNISKIKTKSDDSAVSSCVNGLSLSPRLKNKFSKDPAATQKRPLMVADIKGTQFSSLPHSKPKPGPKKPARSFNTVLKNESLKNVSDVPSTETTKTSVSSASKISSQSVPSPQSASRDLTGLGRTAADSSSCVKIEKRTVSPPRPPPPNFAKKVTPQRPPPPVKYKKAELKEETATEYYNLKDEVFDPKREASSLLESSAIEKTVIGHTSNFPELLDKTKCDEIAVPSQVSSDSLLPQKKPPIFYEFDINKYKDELNNNIELHNNIVDSLNNNVEENREIFIENPKPPPRNRRIRSRTVEIVPPEKSEENLKRSQSLSEIDVEKRIAFLQAEKSKIDSKSLYTVVNKEGKKLSSGQSSISSPELVSGRPLPAPPPPPRRFRSLERKGKLKGNIDERMEREVTESPVPSADDSIKPPSRRKRTDKQRFLSLHSERRKETDSDSLKRASSVPTKPDRRIKSPVCEKYDVNANIPSFEDNSSADIPKGDSTDSFNKSKSSKQPGVTNPRKISHSSWYDESEALGESWEMVDAVSSHDLDEESKSNPKVPMRRKSDLKRKNRETSKFYVNVEQEHRAPPLVDKETSPLPLDCSEKSVQTSLETLSQSVVSSHDVSHNVSHDDQSDDTDELLDLAQTLQKELSTIINRHKFTNDSTDEMSSPPLSAGTSEKNLLEDPKELKKTSSVRSSASEIWPMTSSDESDVEAAGEDSSNLNEMAMKRKKKKIFYIAQEIMTSEEVFVDALKLLNVDFKSTVETASQQRNMSVIPDDALSQILNHLPQLQHLNENLLMELKDRIENWEKTGKIADIIVKMGPFLKLYSWYIHDFESNLALLEDCKKKYLLFAQVVKEFEASPRCKRLTLNHYMLKPIQRIPQYRLLLQEYFHHLAEDSSDYQDTVTALQIVSEVANHANNSMKHGDNAQKLISIQNSIMGHKEIVKPGRVFVKEGELMKLSRKGMQPRWFVLFNDLLLYLTPVQQGLYRVNHELPLTGMKVAIPIQQDYQNEFSIISVTRSFTLAARSPEERQEWIVALTKAIEENASKRSTFTNTRLHQKAQDKTSSEDEGAFVLGRKAPVWIPDARVTMCQLCTSEFTVTFRRHHCRACGKVVCSICSSHRISLQYLGNRIARVCDECHMRLGQGSSACTESGETDSDNQQIAVKSHLRTDNRHIKKNKRPLPSVLKEVCANDQGSTISGYLHKKTGKSWKRDWFVVKDKVLYEYRASEDVAALRSIPLLGYQIELFSEACENIDASLLFQLTHPGQAPIVFYTDTVGSTERWVSSLKTATVLE